MKVLLISLLLLSPAAQASSGWSRYETIIARAPFGQQPPAPETPVVQPDAAFAKQYRLCMLYKDSQGNFRAGLVSKTSNKNLILCLGESENGLSLIDVRLAEGVAVLKKGDETAYLTLEGLNTPSESPAFAAIQKNTAAQTVQRSGSTGVSRQIQEALKDSAPRHPHLRVTRRGGGSGGAGGGANPARTPADSSSGRRGLNSPLPGVDGSTPSDRAEPNIKIHSNGYAMRPTPAHIAKKLLAKGL